jgi:hypothetical protein
MNDLSGTAPGSSSWLPALRNYLLVTAAGHFAWELLQLPLYTIFRTDPTKEILFAVFHCTGGDILITMSTVFAALVLVGNASWPKPGVYMRVALVTVTLGAAYAVFSEWLNVSVRNSWAYVPAMPVVPPLGTGLAPLAQWFVVPALGFWLVSRWLTGAAKRKLQRPDYAASDWTCHPGG